MPRREQVSPYRMMAAAATGMIIAVTHLGILDLVQVALDDILIITVPSEEHLGAVLDDLALDLVTAIDVAPRLEMVVMQELTPRLGVDLKRNCVPRLGAHCVYVHGRDLGPRRVMEIDMDAVPAWNRAYRSAGAPPVHCS